MKRLLLVLIILNSFVALVNAQIKDLSLNQETLASLLNTAKIIDSQNFTSDEKIDSIIDANPTLTSISKKDIKDIYSFLVPNLMPNFYKRNDEFVECKPFAKRYMDKISNSLPAITNKYSQSNETDLANNLLTFFQQYLFLGLGAKDKLGYLKENNPEEITEDKLDKLFIEARGTLADDMIYFIMANSSTDLYILFNKKNN